MAVATPETIFILLFNKATSKYTLIKSIPTQPDSPCLCLRFSHLTNQLLFGCTKEFYRMDMTYLQCSPVLEHLGKKLEEELGLNKHRQPIDVCVINQSDQEAALLCYEDYALILTLNQTTLGWQVQTSQSKKSSSASSIQGVGSSNPVSCLKWPLGQPPLQIKYDSGNVYLFYNDSIVIYSTFYDKVESIFVFKKLGISFIYKPKYLGVLHINSTNYLILSNRNGIIYANNETAPSEISKHPSGTVSNNESNPYYEFEESINDEDEDEMQLSSSKLIHQEDRICLSYFSPICA